MEVREGLRKWATLSIGSPPFGDTMSSSLSSMMVLVSVGDAAIVGERGRGRRRFGK